MMMIVVMGGIDVDGGLSSGRGLIGKYPIGWEARIIHMEVILIMLLHIGYNVSDDADAVDA